MADGMPGREPDEGEADAAEAFEALRAEVAGVCRGLERLDGLVRQGQREQAEVRAGAPDYSFTLGTLAKELAAAGKRLGAIEGKPALGLTPSGFQAELETAVEAAAAASGTALRGAVQRAEAAAGELEGLVGRARGRGEQRAWLWTTGLCGVMAGVLLWFVATGVLPRSGTHWLASLLVGSGEWQAGAEMMAGANPTAWDRVARLDRACGKASTELCEAALAVGTTSPGEARPAQPAAVPVPVPAPPRGKAGTGR